MNAHAADTRRHVIWAIALAALAVVGIVAVILATRWGAGTLPDSASYVSVARNLLAGDGYHDLYGNPAAIWPPGYPLLLALIGLTGADPLAVAHCLNALVFGANIALVGFILRRYARSSWLPVLGAFLAMTSVDLLYVHSIVSTEPLFLLLGVFGLCLIAAYLHTRSRALLFAAAAAIALATFTRYAGLSLVATGGALVVLHPGQRLARRLLDALLFVAVACAPLAGWVLRNCLTAGSATARIIAIHFPSGSRLQRGLDTVLSWFLPDRLPLTTAAIPLAARLVALALVVLVLILAARRWARTRRSEDAPETRALRKLPLVMAVFIVVYIAMLIVHATLYDRYGPFSMRYMAPAYVPALILVMCLLDGALAAARRTRTLMTVAIVCLAAYSVWHANKALWWVNWRYQDGLGFASTEWRRSELMQQVARLDPATPVYTNAVDAIYFRTGRVTNRVPARILSATYAYRRNEHLDDELAQIHQRLEAHGGVIVFFSGEKMRGRGYLASKNDLTAAIPLRLRTQTADGTIYELDQ